MWKVFHKKWFNSHIERDLMRYKGGPIKKRTPPLKKKRVLDTINQNMIITKTTTIVFQHIKTTETLYFVQATKVKPITC